MQKMQKRHTLLVSSLKDYAEVLTSPPKKTAHAGAAKVSMVVAGVVWSAAALIGPQRAQAALDLWNGGGTDANWMTAGNWASSTSPSASDDLLFPGTSSPAVLQTTNNNNFAAGTNFDSVVVGENSGSGGTSSIGYTLGGNSINLGPGGLADSEGGSTASTISFPSVLQQDATPISSGLAGGHYFTISAAISSGSNAYGITIDPASSSSLTGTALTGPVRFTVAMSYEGNTTINAGLLDLLGDYLPSGAGNGNVTINSAGTLNLNNASININGLNGSGAVTKSGSNSRTLTVGNNNASGAYTGTMTFTGGSGTGIIKTGTGTQSFGGAISIPAPTRQTRASRCLTAT